MSNFGSPFTPDRRVGPLDYAGPGSMALAHFMNQVYAWMAAGLALTAVVAWGVSLNPHTVAMINGTGLVWVIIIAQLVLVFTISASVQRLSASVATGLFLLYAGLMGLSLSVIFYIYASATIASAFAVAATMFGAASLYGTFTQRNLSEMGRILFMALIGLIVASVVNIFIASSALQWLVNYGGVILFTVLTAYDTQRLRAIGMATENNPALAARLSVNGALSLYLDFLNLFLFLLQIFGGGNRSRR